MNQPIEFSSTHSATYSAEDDKLRIYPSCRLPRPEYDAVREAGFAWAPKQELFFAMWSPAREDLARKMSDGIIDEEGSTLEERAEARSQRFDQYSDNALSRGLSAQKQVEYIAGNIPFGQPILIGHHSQRRAERDAERIQNGIHKTVTEYKKANYWEDRATSVKAHAGYLGQPEVIHRRIKKLESELRKFKKETAEATAYSKVWGNIKDQDSAIHLANFDHIGLPKSEAKPYGSSLWEELNEGRMTYQEAAEIAISSHARGNAFRQRWIDHLEGRIQFENALLDENGGLQAENTGKPLEKGGAVSDGERAGFMEIVRVNKGAEKRVVSVTVIAPDFWRGKRHVSFEDIKEVLTAEEYAASKAEGGVSIETPRPEKPRQKKAGKADDLLEQAKMATVTAVGGVEDLFATPDAQASEMVIWAEINHEWVDSSDATKYVLEPSAGTGQILRALKARQTQIVDDGGSPFYIHWLETDQRLVNNLIAYHAGFVGNDFMQYQWGIDYDRVVMNPPFSKEQDIDHVLHAYGLLKPGGILVAIVSEHCFFASSRKAEFFRRWFADCGGEDRKLDPLDLEAGWNRGAYPDDQGSKKLAS